jgi:hypothetical protein
MGLMRLKIPAALALVCTAFFVTFLQVKANEETDDPVSAAAIWSPEDDDLIEIEQSCQGEPAASYGKCFVEQMGGFASSDAVAFSQSLIAQTPSRPGYLKGLREAGPVDLGLVTYIGAQNAGQGWALVNGSPAVVNVDDLKLLPQSTMEKDPQFNVLRIQYPPAGLSIEDDDRKTDSLPEMQALGDGNQRFVIGYSLKEPCPACKIVGHASFGFDFDATGKFLGVNFIRVTPVNRQKRPA